MKHRIIWGLIFTFLAGTVQAAEQSSQSPAPAYETCAACHSADGNSAVSMYPKLAGQHAGYLLSALKEYRKGPDGNRNNPIMFEQIKNLTDAQLQEAVAFFASKEMSAGGAVESLAPLGEKIYRGGNPETGVPACLACHGPAGNGVSSARYPHLAGQHADYLVTALKAYRSGERTDTIGGMMNGVAKQLSDDEINAVASYISGLHSK